MFLAQAVAESPSILQTFGIDLPKFIAQCVIFGVAFLVLQKYAYGPIIKVLEERRKRIEEGQLNAERIKKQLAEAELRYQEILRKANEQGAKLIEESRLSNEILTQKQLQTAIKEAEGIVAKAKESIEIEHNKMVSEVKKDMLNLVVETTAKVTGKILTPEDQKRLSDETAKQLAA